jgi:hypothetical protein
MKSKALISHFLFILAKPHLFCFVFFFDSEIVIFSEKTLRQVFMKREKQLQVR